MTLEELHTELLRLAEMKEQAAKDCRSENFTADAYSEESFALAYRTSAQLVRSVIDEQAKQTAFDQYCRGYISGCMERWHHHDDIWTPEGFGSEFERGWNDGYNNKVPNRDQL